MKRLIPIILSAMIVLCLAACGSSFDFDKEAAVSKAEQAVTVINTRDYDDIAALFREDLRSQVSAESIESSWDTQLEEAGAFTEYKSETAVGKVEDETQYIVVVLVCKYENSTLTYTISLDTDLEIVGMYMK